MTSQRYIVIEGAIGVGKTTLARYLSQTLQAHIFLELVEDNPFLVKGFYQDMEAHAFNTEMFFLLARFRQQRHVAKYLQKHTQPIVCDYLFQKNEIFASLTLPEEDFSIFSAIFHPLNAQTPPPQLVVYLQADVDTLLKRIHLRDRHFERDIQAGYLERLIQKYDAFFATFRRAPVLTIDAATIDFVQDPKALKQLIQTITAYQPTSPSLHPSTPYQEGTL